MLQVSKGPIECEMLLPRDMSVAKSTFQREKSEDAFYHSNRFCENRWGQQTGHFPCTESTEGLL